MLSPRTGRPKKENAITSRISVRIDDDTLGALDAYCSKHLVSKGEAVRRALWLLFGSKK